MSSAAFSAFPLGIWFHRSRSCNIITQISGVLHRYYLAAVPFIELTDIAFFANRRFMETLALRRSILLRAFFSLYVLCVTFSLYSHSFKLFFVIIFVTVFCDLGSLMLPLQQDYILLKAQIVINIFLPIKYFFLIKESTLFFRHKQLHT